MNSFDYLIIKLSGGKDHDLIYLAYGPGGSGEHVVPDLREVGAGGHEPLCLPHRDLCGGSCCVRNFLCSAGERRQPLAGIRQAELGAFCTGTCDRRAGSGMDLCVQSRLACEHGIYFAERGACRVIACRGLGPVSRADHAA